MNEVIGLAEEFVAADAHSGSTTLDLFSAEADEPALVLASALLVRLVFDRPDGERARSWVLRSGRTIVEAHMMAAVAAYSCDRADLAIGRADAAITASLMWHAHLLLSEVDAIDRAMEAASGNAARAAKLNAARHAKNRQAKQLVVEEWLKVPSRYPSAERAGLALSAWLAARSFAMEPRTVTSWIREAAKAHGIKLRP